MVCNRYFNNRWHRGRWAIPTVLAQKYLKSLKERRIQEYLATRHINDGQKRAGLN